MTNINLRFSVKNCTGETYTEFINALRARLTEGSELSSGIPVLHHNVQALQRFILVDLSNYDNQKITVAIDVENLYVMAYCVDNDSYFLREDAKRPAPVLTLFPGTTRHQLGFTGGYPDLMGRLNQGGEKDITLGAAPLDQSITRLRTPQRQDAPIALSLIIIIQMVSEAARFRYIETQIRLHIDRRKDYKPGIAPQTLQNSWSDLSKAIQQALPDGSITPVEVRSITNKPVTVNSTTSDVVSGIALLLYFRRP